MIGKLFTLIAVVLFVVGAVGGTLFDHTGLEIVSAGLGFWAAGDLVEGYIK